MTYVRSFIREGRRVRGFYRNDRKPFHKKYLTTEEQEEVLQKYKSTPVSDVVVDDNTISLNYGNRKLKYPYRVVKHEEAIGNWAHKPGSNVLIIDDGVHPKLRSGVLVHEAVEEHMQKDKDLSYNFAHELALSAERPYVEKVLKQDWRGYENCVLNAEKDND
jgi:hypothetical protein